MSRGDMGERLSGSQRDVAVVTHWKAIETLISQSVLCVVTIDHDGTAGVVCPADVKLHVLHALVHIDWLGAYEEQVAAQDAK